MTKTDLTHPAFSLKFVDFAVQFCFGCKSPGQTIATWQRNTASQHCCVCLATVLRCVATVYMLGVVGSSLIMVKLKPTRPNTSQHIAIRWPNARNMMRPTMLRYVALACCDSGVIFLNQHNSLQSHSNQ